MKTILNGVIESLQIDTLDIEDAKMPGLYEPPPVTFAFETVGWQVLGILLGLVVLLIMVRFLRTYIKNRYRREALAQLRELESGKLNPEAILVILKKTAIKAYGRSRTAGLYGGAWFQFLDKTGRNVKLSEIAEEITQSIYGKQPVNDSTGKLLISNARNWVTSHASKY